MSYYASRKPEDYQLNVQLSETAKARIYRQDAFWTGPRLALLCTVVLALSLALLWYLADRSLPA